MLLIPALAYQSTMIYNFSLMVLNLLCGTPLKKKNQTYHFSYKSHFDVIMFGFQISHSHVISIQRETNIDLCTTQIKSIVCLYSTELLALL